MTRTSMAVVALGLLAAGCTGLSGKVASSVDQSATKASALAGDAGRVVPDARGQAAPAITHEDGIWIGRSVVPLAAKPLPPIFHEPATFDRTVSSLAELAERITLRSGIPVKVAPEVLGYGPATARGTENGAMPLPQPAQPSPRMTMPRLPPPSGAAAPSPFPAASGQAAGAPVRIAYSGGSFKGLLDTAVARFGVSWKYEDGVIRLFHTEPRTFQIAAIPGDSAFTANVVSGAVSTGGVSSSATGGVGGGGGGGATGGVNANNSQNTTVASRLSVFSSVESTVRTMLSPYGRVSASPATGAITVVDTPESLDQIAAFIDHENKVLSRQVVINVTVLSVSLAENDEYGINWDLVYRTLHREYDIVNRFATSLPGATSFTAGVVGSSRFSGSALVIDALSRQGKVRRQTTASVVTLNNQPVPVQVARQTSYLQSTQTSVVAQVGTVTSLTPGTVTSGFNMSVLPNVLSNGTVLLQFSGDLSTLRQIRPVGDTSNRIETPELDTRSFLQRVAMRSNETLVISGFEQIDENLDRQGVGEPRNMLLGGGFKAGANKDVIVILITPTTVTGT